MAIATVADVRRLTGLDDSQAYLLFRLPDEAALDAMITDELSVAAAYLTSRAGTNYTQTADTDLRTLMGRAEAYFVAMQLFEPLKARVVAGTHFAVDAEGSERWEALIDTEWAAKFEMLTGPFISDDTTDSPFSLGVFLTTEPFDRLLDVENDVATRNADILAEANGWTPWPLP